MLLISGDIQSSLFFVLCLNFAFTTVFRETAPFYEESVSELMNGKS